MSGSACNAYQIRKIYAIGGALGMVKRGEDDDLLHELVNGMTGKTSIKADYTQAALPLQNRMKALESDVKAYVDMHRAELDGKSRTLTFGTVGYRVSSKLMLASGRVAEAIATLKALGHAELVKTTETLDREALRRQPGELLQQVGAYIRTVDEFYYDVSTKEADA